MDKPGVRQIPEGNGEQRKIEETGCEVICGAPTTLAVKRKVKGEGESSYQTDPSQRPVLAAYDGRLHVIRGYRVTNHPSSLSQSERHKLYFARKA